nr:hypothetical protein [Anaerolineae bacterium]
MSRVIRTDGPGKERTSLMRTSAEAIRRLSQKATIDDDAKDMVALLVYCFRQIDRGIDESVRAWEKRNYWVKAEQFRLRWAWVGQAALDLESLIRAQDWDRIPAVLVGLLPHFEEITVSRLTRSPDIWEGAYQRLIRENGRHSR